MSHNSTNEPGGFIKKKLIPGTLVTKTHDGEPLRRYVCWMYAEVGSMDIVTLEAPIMIVSTDLMRKKMRRNIMLLGANGRIGYASTLDSLNWGT